MLGAPIEEIIAQATTAATIKTPMSTMDQNSPRTPSTKRSPG